MQASILNILFGINIFFANGNRYKLFKISGFAQGTTYNVTYYAYNSAVSKKQVDSIFSVIDNSMSLYKKKSLINQFNASSKGVVTDGHFKKVIQKSLEVYKLSDGLFDVTVKPLVQAWGFGVTPVSGIPTQNVINKVLKYSGSDKLKLKNSYLQKINPAIQVDLNGIAQGYSVDVIATFLKEKGIENYLVELGGEIRVKGKNQLTNKQFLIGIESASHNEEQPSYDKVITVKEGAVTTSGNYRKYYANGGKIISHLINPKTGHPIQNEMISATVWAKDAITADAFDNVFMAMGIQKSFTYLNKHNTMEAYFIYKKNDGTIADTATAGFKKWIITE
jgi:FAD:protein FMN transferase